MLYVYYKHKSLRLKAIRYFTVIIILKECHDLWVGDENHFY